MQLKDSVVQWLLEKDNPSVRYHALTKLLDWPENHREVCAAKAAIAGSPAVTSILGKMEPGGYWLQTNPRTKEVTGDGVEYGAFATTHFCLAYLAELGLDREHPQVAKAAQRYLGLQKEDGDFWDHLSCLYGYNIRTFCMLGYKEDERVQKTIRLMLSTKRHDGGYLCDLHEKPDSSGKKRFPKKRSCYRGSVKTLLAFTFLPEHREHPRLGELLDYFLQRGGIFSRRKKGVFVCKDIETDSFPIIWRTNLFEALYALGCLGVGRDSRLDVAWKLLEHRANADGTYTLDWTPGQAPWKVGKRKEPDKWVTLYSLMALKSRG